MQQNQCLLMLPSLIAVMQRMFFKDNSPMLFHQVTINVFYRKQRYTFFLTYQNLLTKKILLRCLSHSCTRFSDVWPKPATRAHRGGVSRRRGSTQPNSRPLQGNKAIHPACSMTTATCRYGSSPLPMRAKNNPRGQQHSRSSKFAPCCTFVRSCQYHLSNEKGRNEEQMLEN